MSAAHDYFATFGDAENRLNRGRILGLMLGLEGIPGYRDAWVEKWQNPDRAPGVGALVIAFYLELGVGPEARRANAVGLFALRNHPLYRAERDDVVAVGFSTFYFNRPTTLSNSNLASMMRAAVEPVDTDARWAAALATIALDAEEEADDADHT